MKHLIVEVLDTDVNFSLSDKTRIAGYPVKFKQGLISVRAATKDGLPRYNVYLIYLSGLINWCDFKEEDIVELRDVE